MSTSISIDSADEVALSAMLQHHAQLRSGLETRLTALKDAVLASAPYAAPAQALVRYLEESILPHAAAEEELLYPAAAEQQPIEALVDAMVLEHRDLERRSSALSSAPTGADSLAAAAAIAGIFAVHVAKENEVLLPALTKVPGVRLAVLLRGMEDRLADSDDHDHDAAPARAAATSDELDVRTLAHGSRHDVIFGRLHSLADGERLVIVNDHDPKPLLYQLDAAWPGTFAWQYLQAGPQVWRIEITKRG